MSSRQKITEERGQSMVEFALVLPVLCLVLFGIIQFGIVYNDYITLTDATRVGARKAAVGRQTANPAGAAESALRASASDLDQADLQVNVIAPVWAAGAEVTVEAEYPYELDVMGVVVASGMLRSSTTERIE